MFHLSNAAMLTSVSQLLTRVVGKGSATSLVAICVLAAQLVMIPVAILVGRKADVWGRKPIFMVGFAVLAARGVLYTVSDNGVWLVVVQALGGIGAGIFGALSPSSSQISPREPGASTSLRAPCPRRRAPAVRSAPEWQAPSSWQPATRWRSGRSRRSRPSGRSCTECSCPRPERPQPNRRPTTVVPAGRVSPVSTDWSIFKKCEDGMRTAAGTTSPGLQQNDVPDDDLGDGNLARLRGCRVATAAPHSHSGRFGDAEGHQGACRATVLPPAVSPPTTP